MHLSLSDRQLPVRSLTGADAFALQKFNAELSDESRRKFLPHAYDDATVAKILARSDSRDDLVLAAFDDGRIVAYFFLWHFRERVPVLGIGMLDAYQGKGLGRKIMLLLIDEAMKADRDGIELTTMLDNDVAFALYQKVGFRYLGNVDNIQGDGKHVIERALFYPIKPGAKPMEGAHKPPV